MERILKALDVVDGVFHAVRLIWTGHHRRTLGWGVMLTLLLLGTFVQLPPS